MGGRSERGRAGLEQEIGALLRHPRYEIIPLSGIEEEVHRWAGKEAGKGATLTITASPTRGIEPTISLLERLHDGGYPGGLLVPHLSARLIESKEHLREVVGRLKGCGVEEVFVVGGDAREPVGEFHEALGLLEALEELGRPFERVGIAGYPEGHPSIGEEALLEALIKKAFYASYVVSQICFDASTIVGWIERIRGLGVSLPVVVGVAGPVDPAKLARIAARIGIGESARFLRKQRGWLLRLLMPSTFSYDPDALLEELGRRLEEKKSGEGEDYDVVGGLHIYTFNDLGKAVGWVEGHRARW